MSGTFGEGKDRTVFKMKMSRPGRKKPTGRPRGTGVVWEGGEKLEVGGDK